MKARILASILVAACFCLVYLAWVVRVPPEAYTWPSVPGVVTGPSAAAEPSVNYRYTAESLTLTNFDVRAAEGLRIGDPVTVYYQDGNPDNSFATTTNPLASQVLAIAGFVSLVLGLWILAFAPKIGKEPVTYVPG